MMLRLTDYLECLQQTRRPLLESDISIAGVLIEEEEEGLLG